MAQVMPPQILDAGRLHRLPEPIARGLFLEHPLASIRHLPHLLERGQRHGVEPQMSRWGSLLRRDGEDLALEFHARPSEGILLTPAESRVYRDVKLGNVLRPTLPEGLTDFLFLAGRDPADLCVVLAVALDQPERVSLDLAIPLGQAVAERHQRQVAV